MKLLLLSIFTLWSYTDAARILAFFPFGLKSHHYVVRPVISALASRGHQVVYVTGYPYDKDPPSGVEQMDITPHIPKVHEQINVMELVQDSVFSFMMRVYQFGLVTAPAFVGNQLVQRLIHSNRTFDAILMETYIIQEYQTALIHKFGGVGIEIIPLGDYTWMDELSGLPANPSYQLNFRSELTQNMDFWQRLYNSYVVAASTLLGYYHLNRMQELMDRYFNYTGWKDRPPIGQLLSNRSLILVNTHFAVGHPVPKSPHTKEIGGISVDHQNRTLPQSIQDFMDGSEHGVIYFSLGSNINVSNPVNEKIREAFMKVFAEIPQRVLMKWETEYPWSLPENVKLGKWFPQQDILAHNNCRLFITHGGYLSLIESVYFGVPVIGIPFFTDQPKNILFAEEAGIGRMLRLEDIDYETASALVKEVLTNTRYKEEMTRRSKMLRHRQQSPSDEAVYWIEHAIKYPNAPTPKGASLSFVRLHLIDIGLFVVVVLLFVGAALWKLLAAVARLLSCRPTKLKQS